MKCITLWQPWATLIMLGIKKIETRSWHTQHRGPLAIHSAAKDHPTLAAICATEPFRSQLAAAGFASFKDLPRRCIMGTVHLDDCAGSLSSFLVSVPRGSAGWDDPNAPKRP